MKTKSLLLTLILLLLLVQGVQAMESDNYSLNWYTMLNTAGGGSANSANYSANFTIGQSAIGQSTSSNYSLGLGYWYGLFEQISVLFKSWLPLITH